MQIGRRLNAFWLSSIGWYDGAVCYVTSIEGTKSMLVSLL